MITSANLDEVITRFQNGKYDKTKQDITLKVKELCKNSKEFNDYIVLTCEYTVRQNIPFVDAMSREFLAGLIIGILLEKEYGL